MIRILAFFVMVTVCVIIIGVFGKNNIFTQKHARTEGFDTSASCPPSCGHITNGEDSKNLWVKRNASAKLVPWYDSLKDDFNKFDKQHDVLVTVFFAHLNDGICCTETARQAKNDKDMIKFEKYYMMAVMFLDAALDDFKTFSDVRDVSYNITEKADELNKILKPMYMSLNGKPGVHNKLLSGLVASTSQWRPSDAP